MKINNRLGGIIAVIAGLMGIIAHFALFLQWYLIGMAAPSAEPGCEILLEVIHPGLAYLGILGGVLFLVSAYGFFTGRAWAFFLSVVGIVMALLASWFINVPFMAADLPPVYFIIFWPYLVIYFLLMRIVGGISWSRTLLGLFAGLAYITCFMNGVSSTSRIITVGAPIFVLVDGLHWVAAVGWGVVTVGLLMRPREWQRVLGLTAGLLELVVGIPLAFVTGAQLGRFSLFALAPIVCLVMVVVLARSKWWRKLTASAE